MSKIKVAIVLGGKSAEHEISLKSARSIIAAIDKNKYELLLVGIDKTGRWHALRLDDFVSGTSTSIEPLANVTVADSLASVLPVLSSADVIFPVLHGPFGEDGTVQGLFKILNLPFVGVGVLGSAIGMDKDVCKRLLRDAGIMIAPYLIATGDHQVTFEEANKNFGVPLFIKPANAGSSVGVHKVSTKDEFATAMKDAFQFDSKVLIEENVSGREIECAVLGNHNPTASVAGEIIPKKGFYSYESKYLDENGAVLSAPAKLSSDELKMLQETSVKAFKILCCEGLSRVDFFLRPNGDLILNEINTLPGFTSISMYPKLWQLSGIEFPQLIDKLITLAIERHSEESKLKTSY